ncbi:hypothetical protein HBH56_153100 [Parastagonospora nodorum]|uniref:RING-type domain-containing protein n=2 Tax=Phaeosphaeria nodorum (strain SN15 / ATCC MYA-4574 / FGSC 10173) TaxID=321614 RepID=A0A7U2F1S1_PHANO|nr:hypothetical protein SNOG_05675 [Parastagonospora nodorum SN15]KAH3909852.1 hypothetical protein HBH56_153100 [Parastagonospora nodorum]EAT86739.1 hypothetical protein SNOG_05675 [Parastagonospora nodorum SN15]KAH3926651.1 hypothetical protein HBH54_164580 [Parastagonospora nodorum]KAH3972094.1 hypothetical protein HBH51_106890 [Parastagonospora nodorum]KAH3996758.1 hypothetical protein HBI10_152630 [Parastagonospora nodorum]
MSAPPASFCPAPKTMDDFLDSGMVKVKHPAQSNCDICLEKFTTSDYAVQIRGINGCRHIFGRKCITTWLYEHSTCPVCRVKLHGSYRPPFVSSIPEELQHEEPHRFPPHPIAIYLLASLGQADSSSRDASSFTGITSYIEDALPRRQPQTFMPDLSQEAEPGSRYPTHGRAISPPLTPAARQQRRHRILTQLRMTRDSREHYEAELQNSHGYESILLQRISALLAAEARLMRELDAVPTVPAAEPVTRIIVARFSITDANTQEEGLSDTKPTSWVRRVFRKIGERFGYRS